MANLIEVQLKSDIDINDIEDTLLDDKVISISTFQSEDISYVSILFLESKEHLIKNILKNIFGEGIPYTQKNLAPKNWVAENQKSLTPVSLNSLSIHNDNYPKNKYKKIDIVINESIAFGTGHHETTIGCVRAMLYISKYNNNVEQILDIGSGTGLLAIIGAKLWKSKVLAVDNDNNAVVAANTNAKNNNVSTYVTSKYNDVVKSPEKITTNSKFDLIVVNIYSNTINEIRNDISNMLDKKGFVILSGFNVNQKRSIEANFRNLGIITIKRFIVNNWVTLVLKSTI